MNDDVTATREALREIVRLAGEVARRDGEMLALKNRALEIAAMAEVMLWSIAPDDSEFLYDLYAA